jgi:hypothetical protein
MDFSTQEIDQVVRGYVTCALWSSCDEEEVPLDQSYDYLDITADAEAQMRAECIEFMEANAADLREYVERREIEPSEGTAFDYAGHDLWLTRNGHGTGFRDRGLGELGKRLTEAAYSMGESYLMPMSSGSLYVN